MEIFADQLLDGMQSLIWTATEIRTQIDLGLSHSMDKVGVKHSAAQEGASMHTVDESCDDDCGLGDAGDGTGAPRDFGLALNAGSVLMTRELSGGFLTDRQSEQRLFAVAFWRSSDR